MNIISFQNRGPQVRRNTAIKFCHAIEKYFVNLEHSRKQVVRGQNIVADGWAGASNSHPHPHPHPTHKNTQKLSTMLIFPLFDLIIMDQRTDGWSLIKSCVSATKKL